MKRLLLYALLLPLILAAEERVVDLQNLGKIIYCFEGDLCEKIVRLTPSGEIKYQHIYHYDYDQRIVSETLIGSLGKIEYSTFKDRSCSDVDQCNFEESNIEKVFDEHGRLIQKGANGYFYEDDRLIRVVTDQNQVFFTYDDEGRKASKKTTFPSYEEEEFYLYLGKNEIGSFSQEGELKWLRIPGMTTHPDLIRAIALETEDAIYAPIYDFQWNIIKLVNIDDGSIIETRPDPFGRNLNELKGCPWTFCSKRYDPETGLVDFGYRNYDPELGEWTALDPFMQDDHPYRYCFNNPMHYLDPDGGFAIAIPLLTWTGTAITSPLWAPGALAIASGAAVGYLSYKGYQYWQKHHEEKEENKPPYTWDDLGDDPTQCPDEGFVWKGRGEAGVGKGKWVRGPRAEKEELYPDFDHPEPIGPHWDYWGPNFPEGVRIKPDGTWEKK